VAYSAFFGSATTRPESKTSTSVLLRGEDFVDEGDLPVNTRSARSAKDDGDDDDEMPSVRFAPLVAVLTDGAANACFNCSIDLRTELN